MYRILFEKKGQAIWISHLDLMRLFQRAFMRAGLPLTHTQGYNPRPSVSIAMPLSVGVESSCELLDFDLDGTGHVTADIGKILNDTLIDGVRVLDVYQNGQKLKDLAYMQCKVTLQYDSRLPDEAELEIDRLFRSESLTVSKKSKNGIVEQDIIPMIKQLKTCKTRDTELVLEAVVCCQNPSLNPMQLVAAVEKYLPQWKPDFSFCTRCEIYNTDHQVFR